MSLALVFWACYALSLVFPEMFWATHSVAFLPLSQKLGLLIVSLLCIILGPFLPDVFAREEREDKRLDRWIIQILLCVIMGSLCYMFPIFQDVYGDAVFLRPQIDVQAESLAPGSWASFFSLDLTDSKIGLVSFFFATVLTSILLEMNGIEALLLLEIVLGMVFVFAWFQAVAAYIGPGPRRFIVYLIGMLAPFTQIFFGHVEVYAFESTFLMVFFSLLLLYFKHNRKAYLWSLIPAYFLVLRFHITGLLVTPLFVLAFIHAFAKDGTSLSTLFQWKKLFRFVLLPIYGLGACVYLFITRSFYDTRFFQGENMTDFLFLPVVATDDPPLDRYNLLSLAHFWDFLTVPFIWSSAVFFILVFVLIFYRKKITWHTPALMFSTLALLLYLPTFFCLNPLLSMPIDWDLVSLVAPGFLIVGMLLIAQLPAEKWRSQLLYASLGLCLLGSSFMLCNSQRVSLGTRLMKVGKYCFTNYWLGSSTDLEKGAILLAGEEGKIPLLKEEIEDLKEHATPGNDLEYAELIAKIGRYHAERGAYAEAVPYFEKAFQYAPELRDLSYQLVVSYFMLKEYERAHGYGDELIKIGYPNPKKANRMALHISLEAAAYQDAIFISDGYLQRWPDDARIQEINRLLKAGEQLEDLKFFFREK